MYLLPMSSMWQSNYFALFQTLGMVGFETLAVPAGICCHCRVFFVLDDTVHSQILLIQTFHSRQADLFLLQAQLIDDYFHVCPSTSCQPTVHCAALSTHCPRYWRDLQVFWLSNPISSRKKNHALSKFYILHA